MFLCHGLASVFGVLGSNRGSGEAVPFGVWPGWWAALIQLVCGTLVMVGLLTRGSAVIASGSMAYAYFVVHQPHGLLPLVNQGELAAVYAWAFLLVAALGPGPWAVDALIRPSGERRAGRGAGVAAAG
ncbi:DoxX family protein [Streptomyces sp. F63]|nr:DoxX family protein [Streptomyces sp. F63]